MRITVIGTGYVGLVTGACLSELGHTVACLDIDDGKIELLKSGSIPIYEPGLCEMVGRNAVAGRLSFTTDYGGVVPGSDAVMIAVGTPSLPNGDADLTAVRAALGSLAPHLDAGATVVMKSTVPVGTTRDVRDAIQDLRPDLDFGMASNPEFLRQGAAVEDFMHPDRIVVGADDEDSADALRHMYQPLLHRGAASLFTTVETAELVKYASNAFLSVKLSFINEMADLSEEVGACVEDIATGMGMDSRISDRFLAAGPGYGGSCFPKDTQALYRSGERVGVPSKLVGAAISVNDERRDRMVDKISDALAVPVDGAKIALLGITFKANTDDLRESPAVRIAEGLVAVGAEVRVYDPQGMENARKEVTGVAFCADAYAAAEGADAVVIATEWGEFATLDLARLHGIVAHPVLVDLRNLYDPDDAADAGFEYVSIGRPQTAAR